MDTERKWRKCIYSVSESEPQLLIQVRKRTGWGLKEEVRREESVYREAWMSEEQGWVQKYQAETYTHTQKHMHMPVTHTHITVYAHVSTHV